MRFNEIANVDEMALSTYKTFGDFTKKGAFRDADRKLIPHPKSELKTQKFFEKTPYDFRLFFSHTSGRALREYGPMNPDDIYKFFKKEQADQILANHEDAITVVFLGNYGDEKVLMTPWIMAHRFGHAIQAGVSNKWNAWTEAENHFFSTINSLLNDFYNKSQINKNKGVQLNVQLTPEYNALFNAIGTQRSSRTGQIRRPYEFMYELFAQYLGTGQIILNPFPTNLGYGRKVFGRPTNYMNIKPEYRDETERKYAAEILARDMEIMFNDVLSDSVGKIFVM